MRSNTLVRINKYATKIVEYNDRFKASGAQISGKLNSKMSILRLSLLNEAAVLRYGAGADFQGILYSDGGYFYRRLAC